MTKLPYYAADFLTTELWRCKEVNMYASGNQITFQSSFVDPTSMCAKIFFNNYSYIHVKYTPCQPSVFQYSHQALPAPLRISLGPLHPQSFPAKANKTTIGNLKSDNHYRLTQHLYFKLLTIIHLTPLITSPIDFSR